MRSIHNKNDGDDASLVARCLKGDAAAWTVLVQRYQRLVYAVVRRIGLDEHAAADVFQTVFSRLIEHLPKLSQPDRLQAWIVTTAKREALRAREKGRRHVSLTREDDDGEALEDNLADDAPLAEDALSDLQQLHLLRVGMDQLDERCRLTPLLPTPKRCKCTAWPPGPTVWPAWPAARWRRPWPRLIVLPRCCAKPASPTPPRRPRCQKSWRCRCWVNPNRPPPAPKPHRPSCWHLAMSPPPPW